MPFGINVESMLTFWHHSGVFVFNFEQIWHIVLVFQLLTLNQSMPLGQVSENNNSKCFSSREKTKPLSLVKLNFRIVYFEKKKAILYDALISKLVLSSVGNFVGNCRKTGHIKCQMSTSLSNILKEDSVVFVKKMNVLWMF